MEGIFILGLERCIEVLQQSKTNEDRPKEGKLCTSPRKGEGRAVQHRGKAGSLGHRSGFKVQFLYLLHYLKQVIFYYFIIE